MDKRALFVLSLLAGVIFTGTPVRATIEMQTPKIVAQQSDLSQAVLSLQDLPPGFIEMPPDNLAPLKQIITERFPFKVESISLFMNLQNGEFLMSVTMTLSEKARQAGRRLDQVDLREIIGPMMGGDPKVAEIEILEQKELPQFNNIGESSAGLSTVARMRGIPVRADMGAFRRSEVFALTVLVYSNGDSPVTQLGDIARKLDARILQSSP
ncbi:MAG: hypothetical protein MUC60_08680 [Oscillatoria sp. Prado101]|jgi:hypothetical protein|nr:hypothetical protein [Oscillatoria sp. Prado101]